MHIECYNLKAKRIICKVDNQTVIFKDDQDGNAYADIELEEGKHTLTLTKHSLYSTPVCCLNIFNPAFYIWQFKFLEYRLPIFSEAFPSIEIDFVVREKEIASIVLNYVQKTDDRSCGVFRFVEQTGLHNYLVCKQGSNSLQVKRYKMTYILNSALFMILVIFLAVFGMIKKGGEVEGGIAVTVFFCLLVTFFSVSNIYRVLNNNKQVEKTPAKHPEKKNRRKRRR